VTPRIYRRRALLWGAVSLALFAAAIAARQWAWDLKDASGVEFKLAFALLAVLTMLGIVAMAISMGFGLTARKGKR